MNNLNKLTMGKGDYSFEPFPTPNLKRLEENDETDTPVRGVRLRTSKDSSLPRIIPGKVVGYDVPLTDPYGSDVEHARNIFLPLVLSLDAIGKGIYFLAPPLRPLHDYINAADETDERSKHYLAYLNSPALINLITRFTEYEPEQFDEQLLLTQVRYATANHLPVDYFIQGVNHD